jgi:hypothetical protein
MDKNPHQEQSWTDSANSIFIVVNTPADTTVRPARPALLRRPPPPRLPQEPPAPPEKPQ